MKPDNYKYFAELLLNTSGLALGDNKDYLLNARLGPIAEKHDLSDLDGLVDMLRQNPAGPLTDELVEAMTTNETSFFRDGKPFELLINNVLPKLMETRASSKKLRIWTAAASTGQEAYSIALAIKERIPQLAPWQLEIFGTDISDKAIGRAREGVYNHFEVQRGLPAMYLIKHFEKEGKQFRLKDALRDGVSFQKANLRDAFTNFGKFDVIFVRNVLIYFNANTKKDILERMVNSLSDDGYLFLGGAETTLGVTTDLKRTNTDHGTVYVKSKTDPALIAFS